MNRRMLAASIATVLIVFSLTGSGRAGSIIDETTFGANVGISFPTGDAGDAYNMGFCLGVHGFYPYRDNIHIGGRFAYNRWGIDDIMGGGAGCDADGHGSIIEVLPQVRYLFSRNETSNYGFFALGGLGFYRFGFDYEIDCPGTMADGDYSDSEIKLGLCLGGGVTIGSEGGRIYEVIPVYNIVFTEDSNFTYLAISVGISFGKQPEPGIKREPGTK